MNLELLLAALLTLAVETAFLALTCRRDAAFLALCAAANAATNLTLNLILVLLPGSAAAWLSTRWRPPSSPPNTPSTPTPVAARRSSSAHARR